MLEPAQYQLAEIQRLRGELAEAGTASAEPVWPDGTPSPGRSEVHDVLRSSHPQRKDRLSVDSRQPAPQAVPWRRLLSGRQWAMPNVFSALPPGPMASIPRWAERPSAG
jgi:hypothetical protein